MDPELVHIGNALDSTILEVTDAPWGSRNRTVVIRFADGRQLVVQRYRDRQMAVRRIHSAAQLAPRLNAIGVPTPLVVAHDLSANPPWAAYDRLPGEVCYVAAGDDLSHDTFPSIAADMGRISAAIRQLDPADLDLPTSWTRTDELIATARQWLRDLTPYLSIDDRHTTASILDAAPDLLMHRPIAVCHGDFGPQNVLVENGRVTALLDFEDARIADPLLDVAWWAWIVRAHTPAAFQRSWHRFVASAHVDGAVDDLLTMLIVLRLLETADIFHRTRRDHHRGWAVRLSSTLRWCGSHQG